MQIDWALFASYAAPALALFVGAALHRILERRSKLVSYLAHTSAVAVRAPDGKSFPVHTHSIVVRNAGRRTATNVRVGHNVLPDFSVYPNVKYEVDQVPSGGREIVFPSLVPGEQVTITYIYAPPLLFSGVNSYTKSDEGFAHILNVLPVPQAPLWLQRTAALLMILGIITVLYGVGQVLLLLLHHYTLR